MEKELPADLIELEKDKIVPSPEQAAAMGEWVGLHYSNMLDDFAFIFLCEFNPG